MALTVEDGASTPVHGVDVHLWGARVGGFDVDNRYGELHAETFVETPGHAHIQIDSHLVFVTRRLLSHLGDLNGFGCITVIYLLTYILEHSPNSTGRRHPRPRNK